MEGSRLRARDVIVIFILAIIVFSAGFILGQLNATGLFVKLGVRVLESKGIDLEINEELIRQGITAYKNNLGHWLG